MVAGSNEEGSSVADDWETGEEQQEQQLKSKQNQVRILKRAEAERAAAAAAQNNNAASASSAAVPLVVPAQAKQLLPQSGQLSATAAPMKILRRPASGTNVAAAAVAAPPAATGGGGVTGSMKAASSASLQSAANEDKGVEDGEAAPEGGESATDDKQQKNFEARMANYQTARSRILGDDYKPEEVKSPNPTGRSKSPEMMLQPGVAGGGVPVRRMAPPQPLSSGIPPLSHQNPPHPHILAAAAYQQMMMGAPYGTIGPYANPPPGGSMMSAVPGAGTVPTTGLPNMSVPPPPVTAAPQQQGYHDYFDTQAYGGGGMSGPLGTMPTSLAAALPPPVTTGGGYGMPPSFGLGPGAGGFQQPASGYGRPPQPLFPNPDISFRHVPSTANQTGPNRQQRRQQ